MYIYGVKTGSRSSLMVKASDRGWLSASSIERLANKDFILPEMKSLIGQTLDADSLGVNSALHLLDVMYPLKRVAGAISSFEPINNW
ncbi:hypothetical protein TNCV_4021251 [Trichonephila clavipes]|nr:hypothetical protein TNCV_4021251 [Trichonephila clavipes]